MKVISRLMPCGHSLPHQNDAQKSSVLLETTVQELNNIDPYVCAFCVKEDPPSSDGLSTVDWIECGIMCA